MDFNNIFERWPEIIDAMKLLFPSQDEQKEYLNGVIYETSYKNALKNTIYELIGLECDNSYFITQSEFDRETQVL